ncbi:MAG: hypothetical protein CR960_02505 [Pasteurellales bacterium]|nr:MAG: hypothetical protein CR960_02505 [Pasteurellales bacterium]
MKKFSLISLVSCIFLFASNTSLATSNFKISILQYNPNSGSAIESKSNEISLSQKNKQVCWFNTGLKPNSIYHIKQTIISPNDGFFSMPAGITLSNEEKTRHAIVSTNKASAEGVINTCWAFATDTDPIGDYSLQVKVNQDEYPALKFKLNCRRRNGNCSWLGAYSP